jgi:hypothetical protein
MNTERLYTNEYIKTLLTNNVTNTIESRIDDIDKRLEKLEEVVLKKTKRI